MVFLESLIKSLFQKYFKILGIAETNDQDIIKNAYLNLVKRFHPDSGTEEANAEKFQEVSTKVHLVHLINYKKYV